MADTQTMPRLLQGLSEITPHYDHFILDIWGVLHDGLRAYDGVLEALTLLQDQGKQVGLLSNSPNRGHVIRDNLARQMGIEPHLYNHILTSGDSTYQALSQYQGGRVFCFWSEEQPTCLQGLDIHRVTKMEEADVVLVSLLPHHATLDEYRVLLESMKQANLPMICANADLVVNIGRDLVLCAGTIAQAYEEIGGNVSWHGKPHREMYVTLHEMMEHPDPKSLCAIGDSIRTDIQGGAGFGIDTIWNLVGIHAHEIMPDNHIDARAYHATADDWLHQPRFLMTGLKP